MIYGQNGPISIINIQYCIFSGMLSLYSVAVAFAVDILKPNQQNNLVVRKTVTSFTKACFIPKEKRVTICEALLCLCWE